MTDGPISIDRLSAVHRYDYALYAHCDACGHRAVLDLPAIIERHGDRQLLDLKVRCSSCGRRGVAHLLPFTRGGYPVRRQ